MLDIEERNRMIERKSAYEAGLNADKWQPIEDYIENDHEIVLILLSDETLRLCCFMEEMGFLIEGSADEYIEIEEATHFFIIPELNVPSGDSNGD